MVAARQAGIHMQTAITLDGQLEKGGGTIYMDGSCFEGQHPALAVAGTAVVQTGSGKAVLAALPGAFKQTAAGGEHLAALILSRMGEQQLNVVGDCQSVLRLFHNIDTSDDVAMPFGCFWREIKQAKKGLLQQFSRHT